MGGGTPPLIGGSPLIKRPFFGPCYPIRGVKKTPWKMPSKGPKSGEFLGGTPQLGGVTPPIGVQFNWKPTKMALPGSLAHLYGNRVSPRQNGSEQRHFTRKRGPFELSGQGTYLAPSVQRDHFSRTNRPKSGRFSGGTPWPRSFEPGGPGGSIFVGFQLIDPPIGFLAY